MPLGDGLGSEQVVVMHAMVSCPGRMPAGVKCL
jgi:hypothetical protein